MITKRNDSKEMGAARLLYRTVHLLLKHDGECVYHRILHYFLRRDFRIYKKIALYREGEMCVADATICCSKLKSYMFTNSEINPEINLDLSLIFFTFNLLQISCACEHERNGNF